MKGSLILFFATLISLINGSGIYKVHSHSGSWCDYETKLGRVNIQVSKENVTYDKSLNFTMTLIDKNNNKTEYPAKCYIGEQKNNNFIAFCLFNPTNYDTSLHYKNNTLAIINDTDKVEIGNDFYVIAQKCSSSEGYVEKDYNNIKLTFRQVNRFIYNLIDSQITFKLFVITTKPLTKGDKIYVYLYLILKDGTIENKLSKAICTLDENANPNNSAVQADFSCKIDGLDKQYVTFLLNNSDELVGIPKEETLINPVKTADAIKKGNLKDFSKKENKVPPLFGPKLINGTTCSELGEFKITGTFNDTINLNNTIDLGNTEFILPISYPHNYTSKCNIGINEAGVEEINCKIGNELVEESLIFEQQIIRIGSEELFILGNIKSGQMNCTSGNISLDDEWSDYNETEDIIEAEKKSNLSISFRQLNSFYFNDSLITFYFFGLTTSPLTEGKTINLYVNLIHDNETDDNLTLAICTLVESVNVTEEQRQIQANFSCNITVNETINYTSFVLKSTNDVAGIPKDETLLNPVKTQEAIENGKLTDYLEEKNKNKFPPIFIPEKIDGTSCSEEGEFKIIGSLNATEIKDDIIEFTLPMTYPQNYSSNCTIIKNNPGKGEIRCVLENELFGKPLIIEQQTIRNGLEELLTLKNIKSNNYLYCGNIDIKEKVDREKAQNRTKIPITFRQIKNFTSYTGGITFMIFVLITKNIEPNETIILFVNLIKDNGEKEDEATEVKCFLSNNINNISYEIAQGEFICNKTGLIGSYSSLRLNSSENVTGIPKDEILLDPVLTEIAIKNNIINDFSIKENKEKIAPTFNITNIDEGNCSIDGQLIIEGNNITEKVKNDYEFNIPLLYPEGTSLKCHFDKEESESNKIICQTDNDIENKKIMTEQIIIKEGKEEILNLRSFSIEKKITCTNGLLQKVKNKNSNIIAFRQVSHLNKNGKDGFSFIFISLISEKPVEPIKMKIIVIINGQKKEKVANCTFINNNNNTESNDGKQVQGDFKCDVIVDNGEYTNINFTNVESIKISPDNEQISGISELDNNQTSPLATDIAINETKNNNDANSTVLSECIDYYKVENKIPPSLEITNINTISDFNEKGKLRFIGKLSEDINETMVFEIPLAFPSTKLKCKVVKAKANKTVEIICKVQKEFKLAKTFVFEPRIIKKKT